MKFSEFAKYVDKDSPIVLSRENGSVIGRTNCEYIPDKYDKQILEFKYRDDNLFGIEVVLKMDSTEDT